MAGNFYVLEGSETRICNDYLSEFSKNFLKPHDTRDALPTELPTIREDQFQDLSLETFFDEFRTDIDNLKRSLSPNAPQNLSFNKRINRLEDLKRENPAHPFLEKIDELISFFEKFKIYHTDLNQIIIKDLDREPFICSPGTVHIQSNVDNIAKIVDDQRALHYIQGGLTARTFPEAFINSMPVNIMAEDEQIGESFNEKIHKCFFSYVNNKGQLSGLSIYYCTAIPDKPFWIISQIDNAHAPSPEKNWKLLFSQSLMEDTQAQYFRPSLEQFFNLTSIQGLDPNTKKEQILEKMNLPASIEKLISSVFTSENPDAEIKRINKILNFTRYFPSMRIEPNDTNLINNIIIPFEDAREELINKLLKIKESSELTQLCEAYKHMFNYMLALRRIPNHPLLKRHEAVFKDLTNIYQNCSASFIKRHQALLILLFLSACIVAAALLHFALPAVAVVAGIAGFLLVLRHLAKEIKFRNELPEKHQNFFKATTDFQEIVLQNPSSEPDDDEASSPRRPR